MKQTMIMVVVVLAVAACAAQAGTLLYVSDNANNKVLKYDAVSGAAQGLLVDLSVEGYTHPKEIAVGSDGNLYVNVDQGIARYNAQTGTFVNLWSSTAHKTMTLDPVTNTVYTADNSVAAKDIYKIVSGTESLYMTLTWSTSGRTDHNVLALNMYYDNSYVLAYDDVSAWNVVGKTSTPGGATAWVYLQNVGATGLVQTPTNAYYNGSNQLRSCNMTTYAYPAYDNGSIIGVLIDGTTTIQGEVNLAPDGNVYYTAGTDMVREITGNTNGAFSTLVTDASLGQAYGLAWYTPIPEPATMSLLALGGIAALVRRRRQ